MFTRHLYVALLNYPNGEIKAFYGNHYQALIHFFDFIQDCRDCRRRGSSVILREATSTIDDCGITAISSLGITERIWRYDVEKSEEYFNDPSNA